MQSLNFHVHHTQPTAVVLIVGLCTGLCVFDATAEVLVITDSHHPVQATADARVIELDRPTRIEEELSANLPNSQEQAAKLLRQRLSAGGSALQHRIGQAYQGVTDAWALGVAKIPAVVIDRRYVVYGQADVAHAVARIEDYRRALP